MLPPNGLNFHPAARDRADAIRRGDPWEHLPLAIRRHHVRGWCVRGPREARIGRHFATANECLRAIRAFCGPVNYCWATVKIYWEDGTLWATREIQKPERTLP